MSICEWSFSSLFPAKVNYQHQSSNLSQLGPDKSAFLRNDLGINNARQVLQDAPNSFRIFPEFNWISVIKISGAT